MPLENTAILKILKAGFYTQFLCSYLYNLTDHRSFKQINVPCSCARPSLSENFRVLGKYKALEAMGAMEGTVQEGSIPTWMEVPFSQLFFKSTILQIFIWKYL